MNALQEGHPGPAILLGPARGHPLLLRQLGAPGEEVTGLREDIHATAAQLRRALLLDEVADFLSERFFLWGEAKVHHGLLSASRSSGPRPAGNAEFRHWEETP